MDMVSVMTLSDIDMAETPCPCYCTKDDLDQIFVEPAEETPCSGPGYQWEAETPCMSLTYEHLQEMMNDSFSEVSVSFFPLIHDPADHHILESDCSTVAETLDHIYGEPGSEPYSEIDLEEELLEEFNRENLLRHGEDSDAMSINGNLSPPQTEQNQAAEVVVVNGEDYSDLRPPNNDQEYLAIPMMTTTRFLIVPADSIDFHEVAAPSVIDVDEIRMED
eukprot:5480685-Karenia_brevis.AAC.1